VYLRCVLSPRQVDYRAWYGLGQTYEMLHLYQYAHYYYRKAAYLRPLDARMWGAVGNCLLKLGE
jgi:anaphase-promoting complex subunit 8